ncbi:class I SAM-dependent methyltransferase [Gymnodinialimonas ulvae]|uniref:class I SAM-dependent methyltransferase n=1 Tax=Gymnodinialimonas ulvae TaxID=3126504 RepID=UPI0030ADD974
MDWNAMAAPWLQYEAEMEQTHDPIRDEMMARAGLEPGQHVLDIGPGSGSSLLDAARAVGPVGHVTGIEIAPPFVERSNERSPDNAEVLLGDAQDHAFPQAHFDAAISLMGVMFFRDTDAAFAHLRGAMKPGAALHFACWGPPQSNPYFTVPAQVAAGIFGPGDAFDPEGPGPMRFGDRDKLAEMLTRAGWQPEIETVDLHLTPPGSAADFAQIQMRVGAGAMRLGQAKAAGTLTDAQKQALRQALTDAFAQMEQDGKLRIPARMHFVCATA